ncbi:MAG: hypothetical protein AAB605_01065 [Patescibacteria group bacterium]
MHSFSRRLRTILPAHARKVFSKLSSPQKIQDFLDALPINFEETGETNLSPLLVLREKKAHCFEGAVFAAAALAYHGERPLLMDFETLPNDEDHTITVFKQKGHWGAISKTNHAVLKYRDPVYESPRELAMSFFNEYYLWDGTKSMRSYSKPFDLSQFAPEQWVTSDEPLDWLMTTLSKSGYYTVVPRGTKLRKASKIELEALKLTEWYDHGRNSFKV